ncbi:hypothetical protein [Botrimarina sp.]|uniref:hypothetical protein n=1 Tax=Botrimarina sp. TaxID=2795802 RepID=UPI0032EB9F6B
MTRSACRSPTLFLALLAASVGAAARAADDVLWDSQPYRVSINLVAPGFEAAAGTPITAVGDRLAERIRSRLGGFWRASVAAAAPGERPSATELAEEVEPQAPPGAPPPAASEATPSPRFDKRFRVDISRRGAGFRLTVRETDVALGESPVAVEADAPTAAELPDRLLDALVQAFRPLARITRDPADRFGVSVAYRAARLAPQPRFASSPPGALLIPYRQELDRSGVAEGPAQRVPWTYLMVQAPDEPDAPSDAARVLSHTRRPFGRRPRGRQELLAIEAIRTPDAPTELYLHALDAPDTPLPGYEVLVGERGSESSVESLGYTDAEGRLTLPPFDGVKQLYVKCGSLVVASLPAASGVTQELVLPLIDERARLRAEVDLTSLREELIDTVARRKILAERIAQALKAERFDQADALHSELDNLPGRTFFLRRLEEIQRAAQAGRPLAEARLDRLFSQTSSALNAALDPREIRDLAVEIDRARQSAQGGGD